MNTSDLELAIAKEEKLLEAMQTNNIELLDRLLHDELLFHTPDGQTVTKAMDLNNYRSGHVNWRTLTPSDRMIHQIGDNIIVAVTVEIQGNYFGQEINGKFRYLRVWKQFHDDWKVIAGSVVVISST
ncbi:nuclear transport factor 2 family protein [Calothrix sp. NIES-3974]|uniref:nuclear transport factor 2 family protein n=1 Tax=Calothrix sp. NIES-3974 TaxID=2005462 RepID=UPI000B5F2825|nr:nuclear transport factor 2 family protein [Calothrix sp. NIES-3974]BAZ06592.1 hypothetical protein NIES3974_32530 [Calothrix sp. NIES-3974]